MLVQPEARVAAGRVWYADGAGVVKSLDPTGATALGTNFGLAPQQVLSFAVDPSGSQLLGAVITVPTYPNGGGLPCQQTGGFSEHLRSSAAGQLPSQDVALFSGAQDESQANFVEAVGWDAAGALVTEHSNVGTQNGTLGQRWDGQLTNWAPPNAFGPVLGGSDCRAQDLAGASVACISSSGEGAGSVRGTDGTVQWNLPSGIYYYILLSPDGSQAAYCNSSECGVAGKDGSHVKLPAAFAATGWLDGSTLIGLTGSQAQSNVLGSPYGELATLSLSDLSKVNDLGFTGMFAGVVQTS
jgi:hypothetical protein